MKISEYDLDANLAAKVKRLDNIVTMFNPDDCDGFISYNKDGFYFKKTNDAFLRRIYTEDEIIELGNSLESKNCNIASTAQRDMRSDRTVFSAAAKGFLYELDPIEEKSLDGKVILEKELSLGYCLLTDTGKFYYGQYAIDLIKLIGGSFNIAAGIWPQSIVDVAEIDMDNIIVATGSVGIYKINLKTSEIEVITSINDVRHIELSHSGNLLVFSDSMIGVYEIATGLCIEKYGTIHNAGQTPADVIKTNNGIYVVGKPVGVGLHDNLVHFMELDGAKLHYNNSDLSVSKNPVDMRYNRLFTLYNRGILYIVGEYCGRVFIWKYDDNHRFSEEIVDCVPTYRLTGFAILDDKYVFLSDDSLFIVKDNLVECHFRLSRKCEGLLLSSSGLYTFSDNSLLRLNIPEFSTDIGTLSYDLLDMAEKCNNIDIIVKGASRAERLNIIDLDSGKEIAPSYYIVYDSRDSIIKLINCQYKRIGIRISVNPASKLVGIVAKRNRMFLR